jgi:tetratricopeptide (TPR) repeat protein
MHPPEPPDRFHLEAAQGWLELGNYHEANEDLKRISAANRRHPDVLEIRWHIDAQARKWDACVDAAEESIKLFPNRPEPWIHRSFALHEMKRTREAYDHLLPVVDRFPKVPTIPYNLACYCAQLGRLEESAGWLKQAVAIDAQFVKQSAPVDPDLKPLWDSIADSL